jgi:hypothetical protein
LKSPKILKKWKKTGFSSFFHITDLNKKDSGYLGEIRFSAVSTPPTAAPAVI